jgi:hypothetical protein
VVRECCTLRWLHMDTQVKGVNCMPLSMGMVAGTPKCTTHPDKKASLHMTSSMFLCSHAYAHLVDLSMQVRR